MRPIEGFLRVRAALLCAALVLVVAPAFTALADEESGSDTRPPYTIGIGDVLEVFVYEEDSSETCLVRPDGMITLRLIGDLAAAGQTPANLRETIKTALSRFQQDPTVSVTVQEINSYRIYVLGKVAAQQAIESNVPLRLLQALATAGGANDFADGKVLILREGAKGQERIEIDYEDIIKGRAPRDNVWLKADDVVVVQ